MPVSNRFEPGVVVNLPDPEQIPVPKTRAALEALVAARTARVQATRERDRASEVARDVDNGARLESLVEALEAGEDVADPSGEIATARKRAQDAQQMLEARTQIEGRRVADLRAAVAEEADVWAITSREAARKAVTKLTTAYKMAEQAKADLFESLGVLGMLEGRHDGAVGLSVVTRANGYGFPLEDGLEGLRDAVAEAVHELGAYEATAKAAAKAAKKAEASS